jgi:hypothetical protein
MGKNKLTHVTLPSCHVGIKTEEEENYFSSNFLAKPKIVFEP